MTSEQQPLSYEDLQDVLKEWSAYRLTHKDDTGFLEQYVSPEEAAEIRTATDEIHAKREAVRNSGLTPAEYVAQRLAAARKEKAGDKLGFDVLPGIGAEESPETAARLVTEAVGAAVPVAIERIPIESGPVSEPAHRVTIELLNEELDSENERQFTRVVSAATIKRLRGKNQEAPRPAVVTALVGSGVATTKVAYQIATGKLSNAEGLDHLAERAAATVSTLVERFAPSMLEHGGAKVGALLGSLVKNSALGAQVGRHVGRLAGETFAKPIGEALGYIARVAVNVVEKVRNACRAVWELFA